MKKPACLSVFIFLSVFVVPALAFDAPTFYGDELVVTASRYLQPITRTFAQVKVITSDDIEKYGAGTAGDALRLVPGVFIKSYGTFGSATEMHLKGANASHVLVLIDGQKINSITSGMTNLGDIPVYNIDRIEVVEEPVSSIYGADAVGGVVNIITKSKYNRQVSANVKFGSFAEIGSGITVSDNIGKLGFYSAYNYLNTSGFRRNSDYKSKAYTVNLSMAESVSLKYNSSYSERGNPGLPSLDSDPLSSSAPDDRQSDLAANAELSFNMDMNDSIKNKLTLFDNMLDERAHYYASWLAAFADDRYFSRNYGAEFQSIINFSKSNSLTSGIELKRSVGEAPWANMTIDNTAAYLNSEVGLGLPLSVNFSLRADQNSTFGNVLTPKIGAAIHFRGSDILRYSVAQSFRAPSVNDLGFGPALKPEKGNSFNISYERNSETGRVSVNYYLSKLSNMIVWDTSTSSMVQPYNIGANIEGFGIELKKDVGNWLSAALSYNNEKAIDPQTGKFIIYSPEHKVNAGFSLKKGGSSLNLYYRGISKVFTSKDYPTTINPYQVVDMTLLNKIRGFNLSFGIYNLFNETYYESDGVETIYDATPGKQHFYPMPGRNFTLKAEHSF